MLRRRSVISLTFGLLAVMAGLLYGPGDMLVAQENEVKTKTYRLVRIMIPPNSKHRDRADISKPPCPYVIILKNGEQIGKASTSVVGWESEYPDKARNRWEISQDPSVTYTVQLWDSQWGRDDQILSKAGLKADAFDAPIKEDINERIRPNSGGSVEFAEVIAESEQ